MSAVEGVVERTHRTQPSSFSRIEFLISTLIDCSKGAFCPLFLVLETEFLPKTRFLALISLFSLTYFDINDNIIYMLKTSNRLTYLYERLKSDVGMF